MAMGSKSVLLACLYETMEDTHIPIVFSKQEIVFARTSPQHKLEIVKRAQALGHIVGV